MDLDGIVLSELREKQTLYNLTYRWNLKNYDKTMNSQIQRTEYKIPVIK